MSRVTRAIRRQLVALALPVAVMMLATTALAQPTEEELKEARTQFHRALELERAGNWAGGLRLFREVGEIKMTPQVRFHIALCEENLGKLVAALGGYELALADADDVGGAFKEEVQENIDQLRGRIPQLIIERGEGAEAAKIELDGIELGSSSIGVEVPVDPGPHQVYASAKGYEDFAEAISIEERAVSTLVVEMKRVPKEQAASSAGGPADSGVAKKGPEPLPIVLVSGGGVAMAAGGVFLLLAQIQFSDVQSQCTADEACEKSLESPYNRAKTKQAVGFAALGVGAVSAGVGVYLFVRPEKSKDQKSKEKSRRPNAKSKASLRLLPAAPDSDAGFSLVGRF